MAGKEARGRPVEYEGTPRLHSINETKQQLAERGVAVLPNILTEDECDDYITEYHQWLAKFGTGFPDNINSIIHKYHIGHMNPNWQVRLKIRPVFAQLWGTDKLLTSFDGMAIGAPPEVYPGVSRFESDPNSIAGLHLDQGPKRIGLHGYQGAVYLEAATETDWCFKVIEGSHKHHEDFFRSHWGNQRSEFRRLNQEEVDWFAERGCQVKRIAAPRGSLMLWDSRTVHAGAPPMMRRENRGRWRYVVFACMAPACWSSPEEMQRRKTAYETLQLARHWPCNGFSLFRDRLTAPHLDLQELPSVAKTEEARLLAGDLPYDFNDGKSNGPDRPLWRH